MDEDLLVALRLQEEWDRRASLRAAAQPLSLVDASWELVDPTPDLQALFVQFNDRFFWGRLEAVEVKWSARMTLCAGVCSYEGSGGMCSIRLSEPLLKLRPRKDLVETLLHEMIHAYLFVTNNDKDREGHGPEFCKHMHRINSLTGANITVYHDFYDEVDAYRRHWWRCSGPCQHRQPFYGYVKRSTNRAPSAQDYWWAEHQKTCGGTFIKIKEPDNYSKKGRGRTKAGQPAAASAGKAGKPSRGKGQPLVPFSGKGRVLGETSGPPASGRPVSLHAPGEAQGRSAGAQGPEGSLAVEPGQSGSRQQSRLVSTGHQSVLSSYFPRVSVANQKAFQSVNGSPVKRGTVGDVPRCAGSSGSQRRVPSSRVPLRSSSKGKAASASAASRDGGGATDKVPNKRPKLDNRAVFDDFFTKKEPVPGSACTTAAAQRQVVSCPACQGAVLESQINEHLDRCLAGDSATVRGGRA